MKIHEKNEQQQYALARHYLQATERKLWPKTGKQLIYGNEERTGIEIIVDRFYDSGKEVTAVLLPVPSRRKAGDIAEELYQHCLKAVRGENKRVTEDSFLGYKVIRCSGKADVRKIKSAPKSILKAVGKISIADNFCFDYRSGSPETDLETEAVYDNRAEKRAREGDLISAAHHHSLEELYALHPEKERTTIAQTYRLVKQGVYDKKRETTEKDKQQIEKLLKKGLGCEEIAKLVDLTTFQVIAWKAVLTRRQRQ